MLSNGLYPNNSSVNFPIPSSRLPDLICLNAAFALALLIIENFSSSKKSDSSDYRQLLISEIEDDGVFYCIYDYRTMGRMGQKTRYKFQIEDFQDSMNISDLNIELLDKTMIMIR